ncbi:hypothetical protein VMCG_07236 [Cytospora schulzeri]|uniref:Uncharacterized protein n=1 Tax=Cytospora schulzeri TaxID=448051 RepID=A0A423WAD6_9PEZI|nr:hypothetical protein VMCG_07236 [Valsa malicola]
MANGTFFVSWQLWEEMTFVLAMGIVTVFLVGLVKLWWTNRHMRKLEELDAEKQARAAQMRKSGLSAHQAASRLGGNGGGGEIPFGIKAIESGAEVEGIWIARMASMASRPPDRKWSSKRKVKKTPAAASAPLLEMNDLSSSPSKRVRRGSSRASRISRREIAEPTSQTKGKLESLSLVEEERMSRDIAGREKASSGEYMTDGQARKSTAQDQTPHPGHKGPLGRIQKSLKKTKVTSTETYIAPARKRQSSGESVRDFHEQAEARKPQRFYPENTTSPQAAPHSGNQVNLPRGNSLRSKDGSGQVGENVGQAMGRARPYVSDQSYSAPQTHDRYYPTSPTSSSSSVETFVTTSELPKEYSPVSQPPPLEKHPALAGGDRSSSHDPGNFGPRRSLRSTQQHSIHRLSSEDNSSLGDAYDLAPTAHRYPPNSSRSATVAYSRPQSHTQYQQQQQQQQQQQSASSSTQPSPTLGLSDTYVNVTKRKVNSNFEVLPAGTFGGFPEHMYDSLPTKEAASAEASVRSSFDSERSGGSKKQRKKLRKRSISSQYSR